jgi:hypothetical protein
MGLLDDLKKQAELVRTQQILQQSLQADKTKLVEEKMKQTFQYVNELLKQLAVVKPTNPLMFSIPGVSNLVGLSLADSFIDYRRKRIGDREYYDTIHFFIKWASGNTVTINCDDSTTAQKARDALWASKVKFTEEEKKNARGILIGAKYTFPAAIVSDVTVTADHEQGQLAVQAKNLFGVGTEQLNIPVPEVNEALLEDFAKAIIGQKSSLIGRFKVTKGPGAAR